MDKKTEHELQEKLQEIERKKDLNKRYGQNHNKYAEAAIIFFGTLGPLYILFYLAYTVFMFSIGMAGATLGVSFPWLFPLIHCAIWIASIYSVYRKRSVLDDWIRRL